MSLVKPKKSTISRIYKPGVKHTITIAPNDDIQQTGLRHELLGNQPNVRLLNVYTNIVRDIINPSHLYATFELYPEFSIPKDGKFSKGKFSRIHFHGVIIFSDPLAWLENVSHLLQEYYIEIDTIDDFDQWEKYMTKDRWIMEDYCKIKSLAYPLTKTVGTKRSKRSNKKSL